MTQSTAASFDTDDGPVTVSVARRVRPGREADYEHWVSGIIAAASAFPGHQGASVLRPGPETDNQYVIIYRFDTYAHSRRWERSAERQRWLRALDDMVEGEADVKKVTGLEFWFDLPELPVQATPSQHRMALTLMVVVFVMLSLLRWLLAPLIGGLPSLLQLLIVVVVQVLLLTYVVMPQVTRLLKGWLYG